MELLDLDVGETSAVALATTLIHTFGVRARSLAEEQAGKAVSQPEIAARWRSVCKAIAVLTQASLQMEMALQLLDSVEERQAAARLDHAIATLGIRPETPVVE